MDRRRFLTTAVAGGTAAALHSSAEAQEVTVTAFLPDQNTPWTTIKQQFDIEAGIVQMSSFYLASHPRMVRDAIERHRRGLDRDAHSYIEGNFAQLELSTRSQASRYLGVDANDIAMTGSTTMGLGLIYSGFALKPGEEILTDTRDHIVTHHSAAYAAERSGATVRQTALYADPSTMTADEVVANVRRNLRENTRLLAVTWVHSGTGVKMPITRIAEAVRDHNRGRSPDQRTYLAVDGVHGLGVEDISIADLGVDYFISGTHKWLCGPRGTGLAWATPEAWARVRATIPTFDPIWRSGPMPAAALHTPGGFHCFEHSWAVAETFQFHMGIGKTRIADRIHQLNSWAKDEMAKMAKVRTHTPKSVDSSAGIIAFEVAGYSPQEVVKKLHDQRIIANVVPGFYQPLLVRIAPSLLTNESDLAETMKALAAL